MKKRLLLSILLILFILILIAAIVAIKVLIFPSYKASKYGDRLNGLENISINIDDVVSKVPTTDGINYDSYRLSGKIVNIYFNIDEKVSNDSVKEFANAFVNGFSSDQLSYYDFQVFVKRNDECILIGYRSKNFDSLSWNYVGEN